MLLFIKFLDPTDLNLIDNKIGFFFDNEQNRIFNVNSLFFIH